MSKLNKMREQIANEFIEALQRDTIPWHKDWCGIGAPYNGATGRGYRGLNYFWLAYVAMEKGYSDPRWCTFHQAKDKGWKVNKGEKGTRIEFWSLYDTEKKCKLTPAQVDQLRKALPPDEFEDRVKPISSVFTVFNGDQLDGIPELPKLEQTMFSTDELIAARDKLLANMQLELREGGERAYYSPTEDYVHMPKIEQFGSAYGYMSTFLHESAHASGAVHRLNRDLTGKFGSESYAKEELRAEIASAFTASVTGISYEQSPQMENHAAYIQSWIKVLENNPNELFAAIKDASKISDYLIEKGEFAVREPAEAAEPEPVKPAEPAATEDRYRYEEITFDDYSKLRQAGYDVDENCRQSAKHPDMVILRFRESQQAEIQTVLHQAVAVKK